MLTNLKRLAVAGMFLLPLGAATLHAQTGTPEGTTIVNTATASFTDINNNTYTAVSGSASVKVGFLAAPFRADRPRTPRPARAPPMSRSSRSRTWATARTRPR
jgi:hypothetical protein